MNQSIRSGEITTYSPSHIPSSLHLTLITGGAFLGVLPDSRGVSSPTFARWSSVCSTAKMLLGSVFTTLMRYTEYHSHIHIAVLDDIMQWVGLVGESKSALPHRPIPCGSLDQQAQEKQPSESPIFIPDTHTYIKDAIVRDPTIFEKTLKPGLMLSFPNLLGLYHNLRLLSAEN